MRKRTQITEKIFIIFCIIFNIFVTIPYINSQGFRGFYNPKIDEMKLLERDLIVYKDDDICFKYLSTSNTKASIFLNEEFIVKDDSRSLCLKTNNFGDNIIKILDESNKSLSFVAKKLNISCNSKENIELSLSTRSNISFNEPLFLKISINYIGCKTKYKLLRIYLDDKIESEVQVKLYPEEKIEINRKIEPKKTGKHKVRIELDEKSVETYVEVYPYTFAKLNLFLVLILLFILFKSFGLDSIFYFFSIFLSFIVLASLTIDFFQFKIFEIIQISFILLFIILIILIKRR